MTETLIRAGYSLSCGALAFHCFEVVLGYQDALWGLIYYLMLAITGLMLRDSYRRYLNDKSQETQKRLSLGCSRL